MGALDSEKRASGPPCSQASNTSVAQLHLMAGSMSHEERSGPRSSLQGWLRLHGALLTPVSLADAQQAIELLRCDGLLELEDPPSHSLHMLLRDQQHLQILLPLPACPLRSALHPSVVALSSSRFSLRLHHEPATALSPPGLASIGG